MADGSRALKNIKRTGSQIVTGRGEKNRSPGLQVKPSSAHGMKHHSPTLMR